MDSHIEDETYVTPQSPKSLNMIKKQTTSTNQSKPVATTTPSQRKVVNLPVAPFEETTDTSGLTH